MQYAYTAQGPFTSRPDGIEQENSMRESETLEFLMLYFQSMVKVCALDCEKPLCG